MTPALDTLPAPLSFSLLDLLAIALFAAQWFAYGWYADYSSTRRPRLGNELHRYTQDWFARMVERDNRMLDVNILRNLMRSSQFFASTTMLILGGAHGIRGNCGEGGGGIPLRAAGFPAAVGAQDCPAAGNFRLRLLQILVV